MKIYVVIWDAFEFCPVLFNTIHCSPRKKRFTNHEKAKQYAASLRDAWLSLQMGMSPDIQILEEEVEE